MSATGTTNKNCMLGNDRFNRQIEALAGRRASPARRGPQARELFRQSRLVQRCVQTLWGFESDPKDPLMLKQAAQHVIQLARRGYGIGSIEK
jgi:hypothetical protein